MALQFTMLASGSGGNACFLRTAGFGLLLDLGLGPRQLASRLTACGASWRQVDAVFLTHTHGDHWNDRTLATLCRRRIPLYCHPEHQEGLTRYGQAFVSLAQQGLVRTFESGQVLDLPGGLRCRPIPVNHDSGATLGFRFEQSTGLFGGVALAYASDLGCWTDEQAQAFADVDLLALEFNHDVQLEYASGRSPQLIQRVLGDAGHLSNVQAAALLAEVMRRSEPGRLRHVVQLHLSRECNRPALAQQVARAVLAGHDEVALHTARQDVPGPTLHLGKGKVRRARPARRQAVRVSQSELPWLPGFEP